MNVNYSGWRPALIRYSFTNHKRIITPLLCLRANKNRITCPYTYSIPIEDCIIVNACVRRLTQMHINPLRTSMLKKTQCRTKHGGRVVNGVGRLDRVDSMSAWGRGLEFRPVQWYDECFVQTIGVQLVWFTQWTLGTCIMNYGFSYGKRSIIRLLLWGRH